MLKCFKTILLGWIGFSEGSNGFFSCIYFSFSFLKSFPHNLKLFKKVIKQQPIAGQFKGHQYLCIFMKYFSCHRTLRFLRNSSKLPLSKDRSLYWSAVCMCEYKCLSSWTGSCNAVAFVRSQCIKFLPFSCPLSQSVLEIMFKLSVSKLSFIMCVYSCKNQKLNTQFSYILSLTN